jgi:FMN phosphatase YigB (HAD superfamily)
LTRVTVIAFDVNETLLDLQALDESFRQVFGDPALRPQWFGQMLQLSFVGGPTGTYVDFTTAQHAALRMLAERTGTSLRDTQAAAIVDRMRTLPPHPEVPAALARLRRTDLSVVAPPTRWRRWPRPNSLTPECAVTSTPSSRQTGCVSSSRRRSHIARSPSVSA